MSHRVKRIKPKTARPSVTTPQCSSPPLGPLGHASYVAKRKERLDRYGWDHTRCSRASSVIIDGRPYCGQHAGSIALDILTGENRVKPAEEQ